MPPKPEDKGKAKAANRQRTRNVTPAVDPDSLKQHVSMPTTHDYRSQSTHTPLPYSTPVINYQANPRPAVTFSLPAHTPPSYRAPFITHPPYPRPTATFPLPIHTQSPYSTPFTTSPATATFPLPKNTPPVNSSTPFPKNTAPPMYTHPYIPEDKGKAKVTNRQRTRNVMPIVDRDSLEHVSMPTTRDHRSRSTHTPLPYSTPFTTNPANPRPAATFPLPAHTPPSYSAPSTTYPPYPRPTTTFPLPTRTQSPYSTPFMTSPATVTFPLPKNTPPVYSSTQFPKDTTPPMYTHSQTKCTWEMRHNAQIERNFHHKAAAYLTDLLMEERTKFAKSGGTRRPRWISDEIWRRLENQPDRNPHIRRETNTYVDSHSEDSEISFDRNGRKILHVSDTSLSSSSASMDSASLIDVAQPLKREGRSLYQQIAEGEGSSHLPKLTPEIVELIQQMSDLLVQSQSLVLQQSKARMQQEQEFREQQQLMMDEIQRQKTVYQGLACITCPLLYLIGISAEIKG
ncbi:hypothetical protein TSUD_10500 [Trifolium subterraneum]|nr:hypothetical protein TSUD_10500 [Trifolium subterraneum]